MQSTEKSRSSFRINPHLSLPPHKGNAKAPAPMDDPAHWYGQPDMLPPQWRVNAAMSIGSFGCSTRQLYQPGLGSGGGASSGGNNGGRRDVSSGGVSLSWNVPERLPRRSGKSTRKATYITMHRGDMSGSGLHRAAASLHHCKNNRTRGELRPRGLSRKRWPSPGSEHPAVASPEIWHLACHLLPTLGPLAKGYSELISASLGYRNIAASYWDRFCRQLLLHCRRGPLHRLAFSLLWPVVHIGILNRDKA